MYFPRNWDLALSKLRKNFGEPPSPPSPGYASDSITQLSLHDLLRESFTFKFDAITSTQRTKPVMAGMEPYAAHAPFSTAQCRYVKELFRSCLVQGMTCPWRQALINILRENPQIFHVIYGSQSLKCGSSKHRIRWVRPLPFGILQNVCLRFQ
jgi:hypothetical protein